MKLLWLNPLRQPSAATSPEVSGEEKPFLDQVLSPSSISMGEGLGMGVYAPICLTIMVYFYTNGTSDGMSDNHVIVRLLKLFQETQIVAPEIANVGDAVLQHRDALWPHTECKTAPFIWIITAVLQHHRMHHATASDF